ncbi:amidase signature domain-containing protein [Emericellopsis atlantica]|uniref:Amidase signature domain-containing protein n=1 Tax=Emericellopsis atlantica TaxID=2614577 RepID=A0A9P8CM91_9HYPO|nr:amidase signature domain-containing protein [Emericellopsis atlantica]KAG9252208.1 amidase signature domain-containing protein [Emericellopsis atlantica]
MTLICNSCSSSSKHCSCAGRQEGPTQETGAPIETCKVGDAEYLIHPQILAAIQADIKPSALIPVTLLNTDEIFNDRLEQILNEFDATDDVFRPEFGSVLVEKPTSSSLVEDGIATRRSTFQQAKYSKTLYALRCPGARSLADLKELPSGPYFLRGPNIHAAYALHVDTYQAFTRGLIPDDVFQPQRYQEFTLLAQGGLFASIAVPSTLYFRKDKGGLRGVRISISESMRLEGVRESFANRDYTLFNRISAETNAMAQHLIDLGAVIVGQTKVPELLAGGWEDSTKPWNPRGDQLQDSGAGSSGAAVAVAGYDWIRMAFAVDSFGGLRIPAARNGAYAVRTSSDRQSQGDQLFNDDLDGYGVAARSCADLQLASSAISQNTMPRSLMQSSRSQMATRVISLDWGTTGEDMFSPEQRNCLEQLYRKIRRVLNVQVESMNLEEEWQRHKPAGPGLLEQVGVAPYKLLSRTWRHYFDGFWAYYKRWYGREPFSDLQTRRSRDLGHLGGEEATCLRNDLIAFRHWFRKLVEAKSMNANERTLVIFPDVVVEPTDRRHESTPDPETLTYSQFLTHWLSPITRCSQVVVPFSQIETSLESNPEIKEWALPVTVSLLSTSDASDLLESVQGIIDCCTSEVQTGEWTFPQDLVSQ